MFRCRLPSGQADADSSLWPAAARSDRSPFDEATIRLRNNNHPLRNNYRGEEELRICLVFFVLFFCVFLSCFALLLLFRLPYNDVCRQNMELQRRRPLRSIAIPRKNKVCHHSLRWDIVSGQRLLSRALARGRLSRAVCCCFLLRFAVRLRLRVV